MYEWLRRRGETDRNPAEGIAKMREPRRIVASFTEGQLAVLLGQPDTRTFPGLRDRLFMLTLLDTGIRLSEALGQGGNDVDLNGCILRVIGKGNKERMVGFPRQLARELCSYLIRRETVLQQVGRPQCPWVFPNQEGGKGGPKGFQQRLKRYGKSAGLAGVRVSPHSFRHTFALFFVRNGGSPFHLQKILGHTSLDVSRRYCELADTDAVTTHQELSPLGSLDLKLSRRLR